MTPSVLDCLFPGGRDGFLARYPDAPFRADGPLSRLPGFLRELSLERLCDRYRDEVDLHAEDSRPVTVHGADRDAILWLVRRSAGATFDRIERFVPELRDWCAVVAAELELPEAAGRPRCNAFASPRSAGFQYHFHYEGALLVQLEGDKRVRLAPVAGGPPVVQTDANLAFEANFGSEPRPMAAYAQFAAHGFPRPPDDGETELHELGPGSVLYVPPGWWHATRSDSDRSFAFTTFLPTPRWYEPFLRALELALLTDPAWRRPIGPGDVPEGRIAALRERLAREAARLREEDLLLCLGRAPARTGASTLCPNPDRTWSLEAGRLRVRTDHDYEVEVDPSLVPTLRAVLERTTPFSAAEAAPGHPDDDVAEALDLLESVGALVRGPFPVPGP